MDIMQQWDAAMRANGWVAAPEWPFPFDKSMLAGIIGAKSAKATRNMRVNRFYSKGPWLTFTLNVYDNNGFLSNYAMRYMQVVVLPVPVRLQGYAWCSVSDLLGHAVRPQLVGLPQDVLQVLSVHPLRPNVIVASGRAYLWVSLCDRWNIYDRFMNPGLESQMLPLGSELCGLLDGRV